MRSPESRLRWLLVVAAGIAAIAAMDLWWVATYRHNQPLTIDEAGYIAFAVMDHLALHGGGLHALWETVNSQAPYAPLLPFITSLAYVLKTGVLEAFCVLIGFLVLLAFAGYGIGERLAGPRFGALSALVVATLPGTFLFTREYVFALPAAALLSCAVYALLRSDGLRSQRWAIACGIALGLMLLARTMTIAFVPTLFIAATVSIVVRAKYAAHPTGQLGRRFLHLGSMALVAFAVAAPWYIRNFKAVWDYLTSYGYGAQSAYYGPNHSLLSWDRWRDVASRIVFTDLLVPLAVLVLVALIAATTVAIRRLVQAEDRRSATIELLGSDAFTVAIIVIGCYLALTSSRNGGEGFTIPVAVLLPPLAVIALRHLRTIAIVMSLIVLALVVGLNVASSTDLWSSLATRRFVSVPSFGTLPWINGTPQAVSAIREQDPGPSTRFVDTDLGWQKANTDLASIVLRLSAEGSHEPVAFASRNRALNTSTLLLAGVLDRSTSIWLAQLTAEPDDAVSTYCRELSSTAFGMPGILVTMSSEAGDIAPVITQSYAETAARRIGFHRVRTMTLPDGRLLRVWVRGKGRAPQAGC